MIRPSTPAFARCVDRLGAERRPDDPLLDDADGHRKRTALDQDGQVLGLVRGEVAGDLRATTGHADAALDLRDDLGRGDDLLVQHDRDPAVRCTHLRTGGLRGQAAPRVPTVGALEVDRDVPAGALGRVVGRLGPRDLVTLHGGRAEDQPLAGLVGDDRLAVLRLGLGSGHADDGVEAQLRGAADDSRRLTLVLHTRQLDDDAVLARTGQRRLGHAERVDAATHDLERPVGGFRVGLHRRGVVGLQHDLRTATQIEAEARLGGDGKGDGATENEERQNEAHECST